MTRHGSLAGGAALLMLGGLFLCVQQNEDWSILGRYWPMWIVFGGVVSLLKVADRLVHVGSVVGGGLSGRWGRRFGRWPGMARLRRPRGWFRGLWAGMGLVLAGVIVLAVQNGAGPEWIQNQGVQHLWPLILVFLGIGQIIGFGLDVMRRVAGGVL